MPENSVIFAHLLVGFFLLLVQWFILIFMVDFFINIMSGEIKLRLF